MLFLHYIPTYVYMVLYIRRGRDIVHSTCRVYQAEVAAARAQCGRGRPPAQVRLNRHMAYECEYNHMILGYNP